MADPQNKSEIIKSPEEVDELLVQFKEWANNQTQLPKDLGDPLLRRFLHSCYYDLEEAKTALHLFCTLRADLPELLNDRDPFSENIQKALNISKIAFLKISGNRNLWIWQLNDPGLQQFDYVETAKLSLISSDSWLLNDEGLEDSDIFIMDVKDVSIKVLWKINVSIAKRLGRYNQEAMPFRLKEIHIVNAPSFIDRVYAFFKTFLKHEDYTVNFHPPNSDSLLQHFERSELPEDYGGTLGKMDDHTKTVTDKIYSKRENFLNDKLWKAISNDNAKDNNMTAVTPATNNTEITTEID